MMHFPYALYQIFKFYERNINYHNCITNDSSQPNINIFMLGYNITFNKIMEEVLAYCVPKMLCGKLCSASENDYVMKIYVKL